MQVPRAHPEAAALVFLSILEPTVFVAVYHGAASILALRADKTGRLLAVRIHLASTQCLLAIEQLLAALQRVKRHPHRTISPASDRLRRAIGTSSFHFVALKQIAVLRWAVRRLAFLGTLHVVRRDSP